MSCLQATPLIWLFGFAFWVGFEVTRRALENEPPRPAGYDAALILALALWPAVMAVHLVAAIISRHGR